MSNVSTYVNEHWKLLETTTYDSQLVRHRKQGSAYISTLDVTCLFN